MLFDMVEIYRFPCLYLYFICITIYHIIVKSFEIYGYMILNIAIIITTISHFMHSIA